MIEAKIRQNRLRRQLRALRRLTDAHLGQSTVMREVVDCLKTLVQEAYSRATLHAEPVGGASWAARVLHRTGLGAESPVLGVGAEWSRAAG